MTAADTPRIQPGGLRDIGLIGWVVSEVSGRYNGTHAPNLFTTFGRHRALFRGWLRFAGRLMPGGKLARRETELVILRVAGLRDCDYEYGHHVALAKRAGITEAEIQRLRDGPEAEGWSSRERAILATVEQLHFDQDLDDAAWTELLRHLSEKEAIELVFLVGHYEMLATAINALRIVPDTHR